MLHGARAGSSGDRTRLDRTSCPDPSMMTPNGFARWRIPGETGSQRAASRRVLARTGASRTQSGNDVRTTSPRLRGELRLTLDTLSHIRLCSSHLWRSIHCAGACNFFLDAEGRSGGGPDLHRLDRTSFAWRTYSRTSSASARSVGGTTMPSSLVVCWLMTNSNLDACMTGNSVVFSPLRIRAT